MTNKYNRNQIKENILKIFGNKFEYYNSWKDIPGYSDTPYDLLPEDTSRQILFKSNSLLKKRLEVKELDALVKIIKSNYPNFNVTYSRIGGRGMFFFIDTNIGEFN
jgi:hypothetical protein